MRIHDKTGLRILIDPNRRSAGAKLDVNDADLAKPIMFQTERKKLDGN